MDRRQFVGVSAMAAVSSLAGCSFLAGNEPLTFSASPAVPTDEALSESGYEQESIERQVVTRSFSAAGQTREVEVTNRLGQFERQIDLGPLGSQRAGVFVTFTSPEVEVAGEAFNPIEELSEREILQQFDSQYQNISVGSEVGSQTVSTLSQSTELRRFDGATTLAGTEIDVFVHAAKFQHAGDFIVAVGIYPQRLDGEHRRVETLLESLDHASGE